MIVSCIEILFLKNEKSCCKKVMLLDNHLQTNNQLVDRVTYIGTKIYNK